MPRSLAAQLHRDICGHCLWSPDQCHGWLRLCQGKELPRPQLAVLAHASTMTMPADPLILCSPWCGSLTGQYVQGAVFHLAYPLESSCEAVLIPFPTICSAARADGASEIGTFTSIVMLCSNLHGWWPSSRSFRMERLHVAADCAEPNRMLILGWRVVTPAGYDLGLATAGATFAFLPCWSCYHFKFSCRVLPWVLMDERIPQDEEADIGDLTSLAVIAGITAALAAARLD